MIYEFVCDCGKKETLYCLISEYDKSIKPECCGKTMARKFSSLKIHMNDLPRDFGRTMYSDKEARQMDSYMENHK